MITIKNTLAFFLLSLFSISCCGQDLLFNIQFFNQEDGISDRSVYAVNQDDRGLIWIGTGNGVNQFDGQEFKTVGGVNSKTATGSIYGIKKDKDGNFWIQNNMESITHFDPYREEVIPIPNKEDFGLLQLLRPVKQSNEIWLRNEKRQIFYFDETQGLLPFGEASMSPSYLINPSSWGTLLIDDLTLDQKVELNKEGDTLRLFKGITSRVYDRGERKFRLAILRDPQKKYLKEYLFELREKGEIFPIDFKIDGRSLLVDDLGLNGNFTCYLTCDNKGNYWLVAKNKVWFFDKDKNLIKEISQDLFNLSNSSLGVNDLFIDDHNRLWIAAGIGLYLVEFKENPFQLYLQESGNTSARGIVPLGKDEIFVANYHGAKKIDTQTGEITTSFDFMGLGASRIGENEIWLGVHSYSIGRFDIEEMKFKPVKVNALKGHEFLIPFFDASSGVVYLGTTNGLWLTDTMISVVKKYDQSNQFKALEQSAVFSFYKNEEGIWMTTNKGLFLLDPEKGIVRQVDFPHNRIKHAHEDKLGDFWLATDGGGLIHWDRKTNTKHQYTTENGLSHNVIYAVYEDEEGYLWLPSNNGLMRFEKETKEIVVFQPEDGIANKEFNTFSHYQADDGRLYFGGIDGVTAFHPQELKAKRNDAPFIVTQLQQFNAREGKLINRTKHFQNENSIALGSNDKFFIIDFSLLDYAGQSHSYAWKIKGLDQDWTYQRENTIRINALQYGHFTLQIKARGAGGQWAEQQLNIPIDVRKPFYLEWYFITVVVLSIGLMIFSHFRLRFLRLRRVQRKLEQQVAERTSELSEKNEELVASNQVKDKLFAIIAHDLRGPAFSLQDVGRKLNYLIESEQTERLKDYGNTVDQSVARLTSLLNNLLNWANQSLKTTTLHPKNLNLLKLMDHALKEQEPLINKKELQVDIKVLSDLETYSDEQAVLTITRNILSNAIKFTPVKGEIELFAHRVNQSIQLSIKDNGIGIDQERLSHIFDLQNNKSTRGTEGESGTGLGLSVSKSLAVLNGGDIAVKSIKDTGTIFTLILPKCH